MSWSGCSEVEQIPDKVSGMSLVGVNSVPAVAISDQAEYFSAEELANAYGVAQGKVHVVIDYTRIKQ
jgi:hypothetical protein